MRRNPVELGHAVFSYIKGKDTFTLSEILTNIRATNKEVEPTRRLITRLVGWGYLIGVKEGVTVRYIKYE